LLAEALQAAHAIATEEHRFRALAALAPHLPASLLPRALQAAFAIRDEGTLARALGELEPHLPVQERTGVLAARLQARSIRDEWSRYWELKPLARARSAEPLRQALETARAIGDEEHRSRVLGGCLTGLANLPPETVFALWADILHAFASCRRVGLLDNMAQLVPIFKVLAGQDADAEWSELAHAIRDVGRWFP
jgi:hypothetical protein